MNQDPIFNVFDGQRHVETVEYAGAIPQVGSIFYTTNADTGEAYEVEGVAFIYEKHGGFPYGWNVFVKRVPRESTLLGIYDPSYYPADGVEL
ncbi:hypothetical protein [Brachybacterium sp. GCM10030252]|uniref:hypothetical protein n=1 Tax=Brachybacterium sp. GCM10030252 TaxID=3273380 RepID=UPI00360BDACF